MRSVSHSRCGGCAQKCVLRRAARSSSTRLRSAFQVWVVCWGSIGVGQGRAGIEARRRAAPCLPHSRARRQTDTTRCDAMRCLPSSVGVLMRRWIRGTTEMLVKPESTLASSGAVVGSRAGGGIVAAAAAAAAAAILL